MTWEAGPGTRPTRGRLGLGGLMVRLLGVYGRLGWASIQCLRHLIPFVFVRTTHGALRHPNRLMVNTC